MKFPADNQEETKMKPIRLRQARATGMAAVACRNAATAQKMITLTQIGKQNTVLNNGAFGSV